jgi:hypothetical protein
MTVSVCIYLYLTLLLGPLTLSFRVAGSGNVDPTYRMLCFCLPAPVEWQGSVGRQV